MFDELMDKVIEKFGLEDNRTIVFCTLCEWAEKGDFSLVLTVEDFYKVLMEGQN